ncbi:MAG: hypothetical protein EPN91_09570 [Salinibacterium sp.]|nr:MAG: hypothetical protein EPN91_09570 [Salinibacterium sp.]
MKAAPDDQALLLDLQAIDTKLAQLDHRAKSLPEHEALRRLASESESLRLNFVEQNGMLEDVRLELSRVEADVETVEARIKRDTERLTASSSVKDVAALEQELVALKKRLNDLEEIELTVMERLEEHQASVNALTAQNDAVRSQTADIEAARDAALATIDAERNSAAAARRTTEGKVPAELLALYEKQRSRYGTGASLLRGGVSMASGVKLLENEMQVVRAAAEDDVLLCPSSEAILVRTNESGL